VISLLGRPTWISPAATTLLLLAALAGYVSSQSGTAAHGPIERIPGVRPAVQEHEEWGERTRNALLILGVIELVGLAMWKSPRVRLVHRRGGRRAVCVDGTKRRTRRHLVSLRRRSGLRTGDERPERLLLAGYYKLAMADARRDGPIRRLS
jgi:hypothetical protein